MYARAHNGELSNLPSADWNGSYDDHFRLIHSQRRGRSRKVAEQGVGRSYILFWNVESELPTLSNLSNKEGS